MLLTHKDIMKTVNMISHQHLDIRTVTMGISLLSCADSDIHKVCDKVYDRITTQAAKLVKTAEDWSVRRRALEAAASSATELSAELKGQGMSLFQEVTRLRSSISAAP